MPVETPRLAEIEQSIREEYNHKISDASLLRVLGMLHCPMWAARSVLATKDDQLVRVIQHMYIGKPSRRLSGCYSAERFWAWLVPSKCS